MTPAAFRKLALSFVCTHESEHMAHPDFRVNKRVFASLEYPQHGWGMVNLSTPTQHALMARYPNTFVPAKGAWGAAGCTTLLLRDVSSAVLHDAMYEAWQLACGVELRKAHADHFEKLWRYQCDTTAQHMAAFIATDSNDRAAFDALWTANISKKRRNARVIMVKDAVVGSIASVELREQPHVTCWIGRKYWGKGIASKALAQFLAEFAPRPLFARVAQDNGAALRVLEKCGFVIESNTRSFAHARGEEIAEVLLRLK